MGIEYLHRVMPAGLLQTAKPPVADMCALQYTLHALRRYYLVRSTNHLSAVPVPDRKARYHIVHAISDHTLFRPRVSI